MKNYVPTKLKIINEALRLCSKPGVKSVNENTFEMEQINLFLEDALQEALNKNDWHFNRDVTILSQVTNDNAVEHNFNPNYVKYGMLPDGVVRILTPIYDVDNSGHYFSDFTRDNQGALWVWGGSAQIRVTVLYDTDISDELFLDKLTDNRLLFVSYAGLCLMYKVADAILGQPGVGKQLWDANVYDIERKLTAQGRQKNVYYLWDPT